MTSQPTSFELTPPEWEASAERGIAAFGAIEERALQQGREPHISLAYDGATASLKGKRQLHTDVFFAGQKLDTPESAKAWLEVVLDEQYLANMGTTPPCSLVGSKILANIVNVTKDTEQYEGLPETVAAKINTLLGHRPSDAEQWPWPLQSLVARELFGSIRGGSHEDVVIRAQAGYYTEGSRQLFAQKVIAGLSYHFAPVALAERITQQLPGRRSNRPYTFSSIDPDTITTIGCAAQLLERSSVQTDSKTGLRERGADYAIQAFKNTLQYLVKFGPGNNAQAVYRELQREAGGISLEEKDLTLSSLVAGAARLTTRIKMPPPFTFGSLGHPSLHNFLPAIDRLLFATTQLGEAGAEYKKNPDLRRVVTTMQDAIWIVGSHANPEAYDLHSRGDALVHYALQLPPNEAQKAAKQAFQIKYLISPQDMEWAAQDFWA